MRDIPFVARQDEVLEILRSGRVQFRRLFRPQPRLITAGGAWLYDGEIFVGDDAMQSHLFHDVYGNGKSPYGALYGDGTSDRLRVKELWQAQNTDGQWWHEVERKDRSLWNWAFTNPVHPAYDTVPPCWLSPIHMPIEASRIMAGVTDVHIERVQDIDAEGAIAGGAVDSGLVAAYYAAEYTEYGDEDEIPQSCIDDFRKLWDSINAKHGHPWESNPWVWVIDAARI